MADQYSKIVVVTPIKNEAWILDRFLAVTSQVADHIIIADQQSEDSSLEICARYPKVIVIKNESGDYNEFERQKLLWDAARNLISGFRLIFALDADEILVGGITKKPFWKTLMTAKPGTTIYASKPDLFRTPFKCKIGYPKPLGYMDDGRPLRGELIHGLRVPNYPDSPRLILNEPLVMHYALIRQDAYLSRTRFYSCVEATLGKPYWFRLSRYSKYAAENIMSNYPTIDTPKEWFTPWEDIGIDMTTIQDTKLHWWDFHVLRLFQKYGFQKFRHDDIWYFDWESARQYGTEKGYSGMTNLNLEQLQKRYRRNVRWLELSVRTLAKAKRKLSQSYQR